jgi:hypothetical protein
MTESDRKRLEEIIHLYKDIERGDGTVWWTIVSKSDLDFLCINLRSSWFEPERRRKKEAA